VGRRQGGKREKGREGRKGEKKEGGREAWKDAGGDGGMRQTDITRERVEGWERVKGKRNLRGAQKHTHITACMLAQMDAPPQEALEHGQHNTY
jgi:hypothetical protein